MGLFDGDVTEVLLVRDDPGSELRLVIGRLDNGIRDGRILVLDDDARGIRLGTVDRISPFALPPDDNPRLVVCGVDEHAIGVTIEWPDAPPEPIVPADGVWMSVIRPFTPGLTPTIHWDHGDGHLRFGGTGPLELDRLRPPVIGWTEYAPLDDCHG